MARFEYDRNGSAIVRLDDPGNGYGGGDASHQYNPGFGEGASAIGVLFRSWPRPRPASGDGFGCGLPYLDVATS